MSNAKTRTSSQRFPRITVITFTALLFGILLTLAITSSAQNAFSNQSLEISPPSQDISVDPGKTITVNAKIRNKSNESLPIQVHIEDFTASGKEGQIALTNEGQYSLINWTTLSPASFTLKPGQEQEVTATIHVPQKAAGGRYGSFVFGVVPAGAKPGTAALAQEIASLFLVRISGTVNEQLRLIGFNAPKFSEFGPIPFDMTFKNTGNVHVKTFGLVNVTNMFDQKVADIVVSGTNVFPGGTRIIRTTLNNKFLIGTYHATAIMYYGSVKNQTLTASVGFLVFPVRIFAAAVIILFLAYLMRKRLKKAMKDLLG